MPGIKFKGRSRDPWLQKVNNNNNLIFILCMFHRNMLTCALQRGILKMLVLIITNNTNNTNDPSYMTYNMKYKNANADNS